MQRSMHLTNRRDFLRAAAAAGTLWRASAQSPEAHIDILLDEPVGAIAPEIYGHFVEHLGGVVYDGIWVGERSPVPNVNGLRKQLVDALAKVHPGAIRWPGGCFADQYDWRDGTGPRGQRPTRTNFWVDASEGWPKGAASDGPQKFEPNQFGTVDFARFCKLTGAQPYFAANLRSLPAQEFWRWVEYCNSPEKSTTLADLRAADGEPAPLDVRYWGVGNESWGCGGNFDPEDYATEFNRYSAWLPGYGVPLALVGSGPNGGNLDWTRRFFSKCARLGTLGRMWGWAMHHYSWNASGGVIEDWVRAKGDALRFDAQQYYDILRQGDEMESLIAAHWAVMAESDPRHRTKLVVDEWGAWYASGTEPFSEALIGQQNTMRDAVLAGMTLDTFNRHADKVAHGRRGATGELPAIAVSGARGQVLRHAHVPRLRSLLGAPGRAFGAHRGGIARDALHPQRQPGFHARPERFGVGRGQPAHVDGDQPVARIRARRRSRFAAALPRGVTAMELAPPDPHAHNSFEDPRAVEPQAVAVALKGAGLVHRFPPASVTRLTIALG